MKKKVHSLLGLASLVVVLTTSCGEKHVEAVRDEEITKDTLKSEIKTDVSIIRVAIPSPLAVTKDLAKSGLNYNKGLLNSTSKAGSYSTKYQAAANLGVYGADLGYAAGYNQNQDVLDYAAQIAKLAKTVGVEAAFDQEFGKKLTENAGKGDTLTKVIDEAYTKAERNLKSNARMGGAAVVIAGGWVEGLYIAAEAISTKPREDKTNLLYTNLFNYVYAYNYVVDLLGHFKTDADCAKMLGELQPLITVMKEYGVNPKITQEDAIKIKDAAKAVRNKII